jgi:hypothetical protein
LLESIFETVEGLNELWKRVHEFDALLFFNLTTPPKPSLAKSTGKWYGGHSELATALRVVSDREGQKLVRTIQRLNLICSIQR